MYLSKQETFSDKQKITVTVDSENIIKFGVKDIGGGTPKELIIQVTEDFTAAGAATLRVVLRHDDDPAFGSAEDIDLGTYSKDVLVAGYNLPVRALPYGLKENAKLRYEVGTGPMLTGEVKAGIALDRQTNGVI